MQRFTTVDNLLLVAGVFLIQFATYGAAQSFGVMYSELLSVFGESKSETGWIPSLYSGMMFFVGKKIK